ncbi:hypothetical protein SARC_14146, partial [Sphaeroforma arctica JP610]
MDPKVNARVQENINTRLNRRISFKLSAKDININPEGQIKAEIDNDGLVTLQVSQCLWQYNGDNQENEFKTIGTKVQKNIHDIINQNHRMLGGDLVNRSTNRKYSTQLSICGQRGVRKESDTKKFRFPAIDKK